MKQQLKENPRETCFHAYSVFVVVLKHLRSHNHNTATERYLHTDLLPASFTFSVSEGNKGERHSWEICGEIRDRGDHRQLGDAGQQRAARGQQATRCSLTKNKLPCTH